SEWSLSCQTNVIVGFVAVVALGLAVVSPVVTVAEPAEIVAVGQVVRLFALAVRAERLGLTVAALAESLEDAACWACWFCCMFDRPPHDDCCCFIVSM
ncbi:hypothetical protein, partial [Halalkalibacterium halodurans]|uniref:hypothetical protein n=1 Tax=Halalkalibacterium halodurans TaxID=86665 RepID=UPI002E1C41AE|nr:hypothetical protein [Halalkalibacterium halodurans]